MLLGQLLGGAKAKFKTTQPIHCILELPDGRTFEALGHDKADTQAKLARQARMLLLEEKERAESRGLKRQREEELTV